MLSFATLGNALKEFPYIRGICGSISAVIFIFILLKIFFTHGDFKTDMLNPVVASVFVTFFMGIVVLATYIKPYVPTLAIFVWILGFILHLTNAVYVFRHFILPSKKILPSHYVTFVGIVVFSVTSPVFKMQNIGFVLFVIGFLAFLILTPFIFKNLFVKDFLPTTATPTKVIVAAPLSLCLAGYLNTANTVYLPFVLVCALFAVLLTCLGIYFLITSLDIAFSPSYSAYTFPMVISAVALKGVSAASLSFQPLLLVLAQAELIFSALVIVAVFAVYLYTVLIKATKVSSF